MHAIFEVRRIGRNRGSVVDDQPARAFPEIQDGLVKLRDELDKSIKNLRESEPGQKVETEVKKVSEDIQSGKVVDDVRIGIISGLRGLGAALDKLADSFTPAEEAPKSKAAKK